MVISDKPILFFDKLQEPGTISIFATLVDIENRIAKNDKPYLRLVLKDPLNKTLSVQIWSDTELYSKKEIFKRKYLLQIPGPIHLVDLSYDGRFVSSSIKSRINAIPTQHPIYPKYLQLTNYRLEKTIPDDPTILKEITKVLKAESLIQRIIEFFEEEDIELSEYHIIELTKLCTDKVYTGTIHLITGNPQLTPTEEYEKYVIKQFNKILSVFKDKIKDNKIGTLILIRRVSKDLISLYEFTRLLERDTPQKQRNR
ncbi:MAG: hypothetical protein U9O98_10445 [Asgard group archaeon]|nr:hypothetical protein [Asgard group archaeon]